MIKMAIKEKYPPLPALAGDQLVYDSACSRMIFAEYMNLFAFKEYCLRLEELGYIKRSYRECRDNLFCTYTGDTHMVYVYYTEYDSTVRVVCTSIDDYNSLQMLDSSTGDGEITLTQLDIGYKKQNGSPSFSGMSYAIRLSNGGFIMIDGGYNPQGETEADNLYNWLRSQTGGERIVISAWIITHLHYDHTFTFIDFIERYGDKIEIKALIHNYPTLEYWKSMERTDLCEPWHPNCYEKYERAVREHIDPSRIIVPHNGQVLTVGDAKIEILHTNEDLYPKPLNKFNDSSNIFRIELAGHSLMFSGDAQVDATRDCVSMYGEHLKSDFVQVSHHGSRKSASVEWYKAVRADVIMYPMGFTGARTSEKGAPANVYLLLKSKYREVYFGGDGAVQFRLPYKYGSSVRFSTYGQ